MFFKLLLLKIKYNCLLWLLFLSVSGLTAIETKNEEHPAHDVWITVFVHGILNIKPHLSFSNIIRFLRDQVADSVYARAISIMRKDPFFYQYSAMQGLGLQKIDFERNSEYTSGAFACAYDSFFQLNSQGSLQKHIYYTFGWSGLLSNQIRYQEALLFYEQLHKEIEEYKKQGIVPKIRIVGYSHGGYIALNLGAVFGHKAGELQAPWSVDELILIGVPVICDTDFMINSPIFKSVYHFYSPGDRVQVMDCLAMNRFFSNRIFTARADFPIPSKLTQIQLRVKRIARTLFARNGCRHHAQKQYPSRLLRNADPGHTELWSFGWSFGYRSYLPLYPFPTASYLSYIMNTLQKICSDLSKHIIVDIHAFQDSMFISDLSSGVTKMMPFPSQSVRDEIANRLTAYIPKNCNKKLYVQKADRALKLAQEQKNKEWHEQYLVRCKNKPSIRRRRRV